MFHIVYAKCVAPDTIPLIRLVGEVAEGVEEFTHSILTIEEPDDKPEDNTKSIEAAKPAKGLIKAAKPAEELS